MKRLYLIFTTLLLAGQPVQAGWLDSVSNMLSKACNTLYEERRGIGFAAVAITAITFSCVGLLTAVMHSREEFDAIEREKLELQNKLQREQANLQTREQALQASTQEQRNLAMQLQAAEQARIDAQDRLRQEEQRLQAAAIQEQRDLTIRLQAAEQERESLKNRLQREQAGNSQAHVQQLEVLANHERNIELRIEAAEERCAALRDRIAEQQSDLEARTKRIHAINADNTDLRTQLQNEKDALDSLRIQHWNVSSRLTQRLPETMVKNLSLESNTGCCEILPREVVLDIYSGPDAEIEPVIKRDAATGMQRRVVSVDVQTDPSAPMLKTETPKVAEAAAVSAVGTALAAVAAGADLNEAMMVIPNKIVTARILNENEQTKIKKCRSSIGWEDLLIYKAERPGELSLDAVEVMLKDRQLRFVRQNQKSKLAQPELLHTVPVELDSLAVFGDKEFKIALLNEHAALYCSSITEAPLLIHFENQLDLSAIIYVGVEVNADGSLTVSVDADKYLVELVSCADGSQVYLVKN